MTTLAIRRGAAPIAGTRLGPPSPARFSALTLLVVANAVSMTANVLMTVAVPWLVLTTTGSAAVAGIAVFAGAASATVGGLVAGRVVDALGATRTSAVADLLSGLAVVPLPVLLALDALEVWQVVLLTVLGTLADAAGSAARQSLVPAAARAGGHRRERANALFTSAEHVGYLLGAPAAGLLIAGFGVGPTLWVTVASFAFAALLIRGVVDLPVGRASLRRSDLPASARRSRSSGAIRRFARCWSSRPRRCCSSGRSPPSCSPSWRGWSSTTRSCWA